MRRARWKRKNVRRVGLRQRRPPAAGGGWLALPCGSQGRKRPALGETSSPGKYRDTLSLPPRCRSRSREEQPAAAKREAARCDNHPDEVGTIRHGTVVSSLQKMIACPKASLNRSRHRYADPRAHGGLPHRSAPKRFFLFHRARRILFLSRTKREWGAHPLWEQPPGGSQTPGGVPQKQGPLPFIFPQTRTRTPSR